MVHVDYPPLHVAIIMDGNGRWAEARGLPRPAGHAAGGVNIRRVARVFASHGVKHLTLYLFSTENWNRPTAEVAGLLDVLERTIDQEIQASSQEKTRLVHLGRLDRLPQKLREKVKAAVAVTQDNAGLTLCLAFDYGGRDEIAQAARRIVEAGIPSSKTDESTFAGYLYTTGIPDPDLVIRTGGERRLSNFLLWQIAYSELYFTGVLWPDFGQRDVVEALSEYNRRRRRFGGL